MPPKTEPTKLASCSLFFIERLFVPLDGKNRSARLQPGRPLFVRGGLMVKHNGSKKEEGKTNGGGWQKTLLSLAIFESASVSWPQKIGDEEKEDNGAQNDIYKKMKNCCFKICMFF